MVSFAFFLEKTVTVTFGMIPDPNLSFSLTEFKNDRFRFLRGPVCQIFDKCQFVGKRKKIKGRAIKRFLFSSKSWLKDVGSELPYRQNCAISSDETFVSISPNVRG